MQGNDVFDSAGNRCEPGDCTDAHCGDGALAHARAHEYDAVILDVMLPGPDGFSVCEALWVETDERAGSAFSLALRALDGHEL